MLEEEERLLLNFFLNFFFFFVLMVRFLRELHALFFFFGLERGGGRGRERKRG